MAPSALLRQYYNGTFMVKMADCQRTLSPSGCMCVCLCVCVYMSQSLCVEAIVEPVVCMHCVIRSACVAAACPLYFRIDGLFSALPTIMNTWLLVSHTSSNAMVCVCVSLSLQIHRILGKTVVCYPIVFDLSDFYLSQDVMLLIDDIKVN